MIKNYISSASLPNKEYQNMKRIDFLNLKSIESTFESLKDSIYNTNCFVGNCERLNQLTNVNSKKFLLKNENCEDQVVLDTFSEETKLKSRTRNPVKLSIFNQRKKVITSNTINNESLSRGNENILVSYGGESGKDEIRFKNSNSGLINHMLSYEGPNSVLSTNETVVRESSRNILSKIKEQVPNRQESNRKINNFQSDSTKKLSCRPSLTSNFFYSSPKFLSSKTKWDSKDILLDNVLIREFQEKRNNIDRGKEFKLIYTKIFDKKYEQLKLKESKTKNKEKLFSINLEVEKKINSLKSKIHLIKGVFDYAYPKVMIEKINQMKKRLDLKKPKTSITGNKNKEGENLEEHKNNKTSTKPYLYTHSRLNLLKEESKYVSYKPSQLKSNFNMVTQLKTK